MINIKLPERPPPLSALTFNSRVSGRVNTDRYKKWQRLCAPTLTGIKGILGPIKVEYHFKRPDNRTRDLGNLEKAMSDILVKHEIIEDDKLIVDLRLVWAGTEPAEIWIWECEPEGIVL